MKKLILLLAIPFAIQAQVVIEAPAGNTPAKIDKPGQTIIPNGRIITPRGVQISTAPHPYGLVLSKHISRLEYTLCDNPLVEPVSDLTTDNTKIHTIPIIHKYIIPPLTNLINIVIMSC